VSTPPFLDLPAGVRAIQVAGPIGFLAALAVAAEHPKGVAVLVPGFTGSKEDFLPVLAPLKSAGWTVAAFDQRGQYESKGPDDDSAYRLDALAASLIDLVRSWAPETRVHLVGHSLGGLVVRRAVIMAPDLVRSATLLCSGPGPLPPHKQAELGPLIAALTVVPIEVIGEHKLAADRLNDVVTPSDEVLEFLKLRFEGNNPHALRAMSRLLCDVEDTTAELALVAAVAGIRLMVAHGVDDDVWPHLEQRETSKRLSARYEVIATAKHSPAVENPTALAELLDDFWSDR